MRFDSADWDVMAARGILLDVVLHEMGGLIDFSRAKHMYWRLLLHPVRM